MGWVMGSEQSSAVHGDANGKGGLVVQWPVGPFVVVGNTPTCVTPASFEQIAGLLYPFATPANSSAKIASLSSDRKQLQIAQSLCCFDFRDLQNKER